MSRLSVIIPVYYNEPTLEELFEEFIAVETELEKQNTRLELIFVDDGSGDGSFDKLMEFQIRRHGTIVVKHSRNFGAMNAIRTGYQYVSGDCFAVLPADLQEPPSLLTDMVAEWLRGAKYVVCVRSQRHDPATSRLFSWIYYRILRLLVFPDFPALGTGASLMDGALLPYMRSGGKSAYNPVLAYWLGFKASTIEYERPERLRGRSRWTFRKKVGAALDACLGYSAAPIRMISVIGIAVTLGSAGYGVWRIIVSLLGHSPTSSVTFWGTFICFLLGLIIVMLGILGEYLWRIFQNVNGLPDAVIDEVHPSGYGDDPPGPGAGGRE